MKSRPVQHAIQTARGCRIAGPWFLAGQVAGGTRTYPVRGVDVTLRHRTRDVAILTEIYGDHNPYEPPHGLDLTGPVTVRDLGGNIGLFGSYALGRLDVRELTSFEPDPLNAELLERTAAPHPAWNVEPVAVSNRAGEMRFVTGEQAQSREAFPGEPCVIVPMVDVLALPPVDLLKVDIEGGEWPILADPRMRDAARAVVIEWHEDRCPDPAAGGEATARRLLAEAGYTKQWSPGTGWWGCGMLWAWR